MMRVKRAADRGALQVGGSHRTASRKVNCGRGAGETALWLHACAPTPCPTVDAGSSLSVEPGSRTAVVGIRCGLIRHVEDHSTLAAPKLRGPVQGAVCAQ